MAAFDPEKWARALLVTAIGVTLMSALACAVALARETTGHDWYATGKLSLTELLTGLGFDDRAPVEYRTRDGEVMTLTRDGLKHNGDALLARDPANRGECGRTRRLVRFRRCHALSGIIASAQG